MRRLYQLVKYVWLTLLLGGLTVSLAGDCLSRVMFEGKSCALSQSVQRSLSVFGPWVLFALLMLLVVTLVVRAQDRHEQAREGFGLLVPSDRLRPEHLNFRVPKAAERLAQNARPYNATYVSRVVVDYDSRVADDPQPKYDEEALALRLRDGRGFVLQGPPLDGKSRTLYETLTRMSGYEVLKPREDRQVPSDEDFSRLLTGRRVVLVADDLTRYVGSKTNLVTFGERLSKHALSWVVASTCRDGPELETVREAFGSGVGSFYEAIHQKLSLLPLSTEEKEVLSSSIGQEWDPADTDEYPTAGFIVMQRDIRAMRERFQYLDTRRPEQRDVLRALKLLSNAGVLPFTNTRVRAVLERLFARTPAHLGDCLEALASLSFLRPGDQETIQPEPAYLRYVVTYVPGKEPVEHFAALANVFEELRDSEGLSSLGLTYGRELEDHKQAIEVLERGLRLEPHNPQALVNKGVSLYYLGRYEEALDVLANALRLAPNYPEGWYDMGLVLSSLGRFDEALDAAEEALRHNPRYFWAVHNKATALANLGRYEESLEALNEALRLNPNEPKTWYAKSLALDKLVRVDESLEACDEAVRLKPDYYEAWDGKGMALGKLGRFEDALRAFDEALRLNPDYVAAWTNRGMALGNLGHHEQALKSFDHAIELNPEAAHAWGGKGRALSFLNRQNEALQALCRAWSLRKHFDDKGVSIAVLFAQLNYEPEGCEDDYPLRED